jgi:hypothetical protein
MDGMSAPDLPIGAPGKRTDSSESSFSQQFARPGKNRRESDVIHEVLKLCASAFETDRARFIRQLSTGDWQVYSIQRDFLRTHQADYAEISMAWAVGLSRIPARLSRPRVTQPDGEGIRPIAVTSYVGIPVLCRDHFVGVIELAGNVKGDLERTIERLSGPLERFGNRLTHDPSLRATQLIDLDVECWLDGGCWSSGSIDLDADEWALLAAMDCPAPLRRVVDRLPFTSERSIDVVRSLVARGVVSVRASTRPLVDAQEPDDMYNAVAASGGN